MAEISDSQQQTGSSLSKGFSLLQIGHGDVDEEWGPSPSSSSVTAALPKLLTCDTNSVRLIGLLPHTTERKRAFNIVYSLGMSDTLILSALQHLLFNIKQRYQQVLFFLQYQMHQVVDKLTHLLAFHGAFLWFFVIKQKIVWILPFPSKGSTVIQQFNSVFSF